MPRLSRFVFAGVPYHVTQRGNRREDIFFRDADRAAYLDWLGEYSGRYSVEVLAYCLMSNHVHLIVVPSTADGLERVFRPLHTRYALRVNRVKEWSGHLWQGRYFAAALDDAYLYAATRYVERNPVRAGIVNRAEGYRWSSAPAHCGLKDDRLLADPGCWFADVQRGSNWSEWLSDHDKQAELDVLRQNIERGLPCGSESFVCRLESISGRMLHFRPQGRPWPISADK